MACVSDTTIVIPVFAPDQWNQSTSAGVSTILASKENNVSRKMLLTALTGLICLGSAPAFGQAGCTTGDGCASEAECADESCGERLFGNGWTSLTNQLKAAGCGAQTVGGDGCGAGDGSCGQGDGLPGGRGGDGFSLANMLGSDGESGIEIGGWLQFGYQNRDAVVPRFNTYEERVNLHQGWLYAEKVADGSSGFDWGFRVDGMYGVDAANTQAFGNNPGNWDFQNGFDNGQYGFAIPQAYAEVASGDWSVKVGHFYTIVGYEVVTAPDNFFYSHAFTMFNSEPFTHTGFVATYNASDDLTLYGGWTLGWDTGYDQFGNGSNFLGGASLALSEDTTLTYITTIGDFGARGTGGYGHSIVLDMSLTDDLNYIVQSDFVETDTPGDRQYGLNQYLIYNINDSVGVGGRVEWWNTGGVSVYDATVGLNIKASDNLIFRPEVRQDWSPGFGIADTFFGMDAILTF